MATAVHNAGLCTVKINANQGAGIETLGYTANGAQKTTEGKFLDVPGDANGGDEGTPIDIQWLGEIARVRLELTDFDTAVLAKVKARVAGNTAGTPGTVGTFLFSGSNKNFRLILDSPNDPYNFPRAVPRGVQEVNLGTKYERVIVEFECYKNASDVLYNTSTA